jgi:hypothetical protein
VAVQTECHQWSKIATSIDTYRKSNQEMLVVTFQNKNLNSLSFLLYLAGPLLMFNANVWFMPSTPDVSLPE